jgi:hypothetical protein
MHAALFTNQHTRAHCRECFPEGRISNFGHAAKTGYALIVNAIDGHARPFRERLFEQDCVPGQ